MKKTSIGSGIFFSAALMLMTSCSPRLIGFINPVGVIAARSYSIVSGTSPSAEASPTVRVSPLSINDLVSLYSDPTCSQLIGSAVANGTSVDITTSALPLGTTSFYSTVVGGLNPSECLSTGIFYTVQIPLFSFSQDHYSVGKDGTVSGSEITVTRTIAGGDYDVTLSSEAITADATDLMIGDAIVHFTGSTTSVTVPVTTFSPVLKSEFMGDQLFRLKISSITNGAEIGGQSEALVNLLDDKISDSFFFNRSLYSVKESDGNAEITVGRTGDVSASASIEINFLNGTAISGVDYSAGVVTVFFAAGESEKTALIPVSDRSAYQANRSFYVELANPSVGTSARPWATAKVRILDTDDSTQCDSLNTDVMVASGFGGGDGSPGDPFRICSLSQLYRMRVDLTKAYRLMADLNLDPALDANPAVVGIQAFVGMTGNFSGIFDGDEHVLKNFRFSSATTVDPIAFFYRVGGNTSVLVNGVNFTQARVVSTGANWHVGGIIGSASTSFQSIRNNSFSGLVKSTGNGTVAGIMNRMSGASQTPLVHNFSHGLVKQDTLVGGGAAGGIYSGIFDDNTELLVDQNYSVMNVDAGGNAGGILGGTTLPAYNYKAKFSNSHAKGVIRTSNGSAGGIYGSLDARRGTDVSIYQSWSSSIISAKQAGGLVGYLSCEATGAPSVCDITHSFSTAKIFAKTEFGNSGAGGLAGYVTVQENFQMTDSFATGDIQSEDSVNCGGLIGRFSSTGTAAKTVLLNRVYSTGDVGSAASGTQSGGLIGAFDLDSPTAVTISNAYATGNIASKPATGIAGGLVGSVRISAALAGASLTVSASHSDGDVSGYRYIGGIIGTVDLNPALNASVHLSDVYSSGAVTGSTHVGGIIGGFVADNSTGTQLTLVDVRAQGNITGNSRIGGVLGSVTPSGASTTVSITNTRYTAGVVTAQQEAGGIIGVVDTAVPFGKTMNFLLEKSYSTGSLSVSTNAQSGGLVGHFGMSGVGVSLMKISRSYSSMTVTAKNDAGGLVGYFEVGPNSTISLENSFFNGTLFGDSNVGGLAGHMHNNSGTGVLDLKTSFTTAPVSGTGGNVNGLIGYGSNAVVSNSYWLRDGTTNATLSTADLNNRTAVQLQTADTTTYSPSGTVPNDWDFVTIWNAPSPGVYPSLR